MSDAEVLTPRTPPARTIHELRSTYIERARRNNAARAAHASAPFRATAQKLGAEWGVGVGLHFEVIKWLQWMALTLMICAVPYLVTIGCSIFTDEQHMDDHDYGVKKYPITKIHSMSFAAIVDDSIDNGTLQYMNTEIGRTWKGPMNKSTFLIWISLVDAGATLLFVCGLALLWYHLRRFARSIDKSTLEAADYTVLVRGLPSHADAVQVGEHFSRYGEVMDVVLVTDRLSTTLQHCGRAAALQQRRAMVLDESNVLRSEGHLDMMAKLDSQLADIAEDIRALAERNQKVRAAFVTFNSENERRACTTQCPNSWFGSLLQRRVDQFLQHKAIWVRTASAPEDYKFEHLAISELQLAAREFTINFMMLLLVLVCAAAITKLTDISNQQSAAINWFENSLTADATSAMQLYGNTTVITASTTDMLSGTSTDNSTLDTSAGAANSSVTAQLTAFCTAALPGYCTAGLPADLTEVVKLQYGQSLLWVNATSRLLYERPVREELECAAEGCGMGGCLPCLCLGIRAAGMEVDQSGDSGSGTDAEQLCSVYINQLDVRTWGIRLSISAVVAVLNSAIKWVLQALVLHGRHWTHTARERSFALQCFVAMLFNTVVVLLLTNCDSLGQLARQNEAGSWVRFFVRYGSYSDFTAGWYENVGLSIFILMVINVASPVFNLIIDEFLLAARRCYVLYVMKWPLQSDFDLAWAKPQFTLAQRTADLLLNTSLALLFGSGMPLLYLVLAVYLLVAEMADRWALTRRCFGSARYHDALTKLIVVMLPWLAVSHCAFGLWMHTYFRVVVPDDGGGDNVSQLSAAAVRATNARLSSTSKDLSELQSSGVWRRITQPNGLALLLLFVGMALWMLVGRHVVWRVLAYCGRVTGRVCCAHTRGLMRLRMSRDLESEVHAVAYADALMEKQLHGTPTYRLAHHPHYVQYFAASGLNRAVGVAALVAAAASGGARRHTYTRLKSVQRRGRLPGGPSAFRILPEPIIEVGPLPLPSGMLSSLGGLSTSTMAADPAHQAQVGPAADTFAGQPDAHGPGETPGRTRSGIRPLTLDLLGPDGLPKTRGSEPRKPPGVAGPGLGPDIRELLLQEEEEVEAAAAAAVATIDDGSLTIGHHQEGPEAHEGGETESRSTDGVQPQALGGLEGSASRSAAEAGSSANASSTGATSNGSAATTSALSAATAVCIVHASSRLESAAVSIEVASPEHAEGSQVLEDGSNWEARGLQLGGHGVGPQLQVMAPDACADGAEAFRPAAAGLRASENAAEAVMSHDVVLTVADSDAEVDDGSEGEGESEDGEDGNRRPGDAEAPEEGGGREQGDETDAAQRV